MCGGSDPCTQAVIQSCAQRGAAYSAQANEAIRACFTAPSACSDGGVLLALQDCIYAHLVTFSPTPAQLQVQTDFCKVCPDGTSPYFARSCSDFYTMIQSQEAASIGDQDVLEFSDGIAAQIDQMCTGTLAGNDCGFAFAGCLSPVLYAAIPSTPVACP